VHRPVVSMATTSLRIFMRADCSNAYGTTNYAGCCVLKHQRRRRAH